MSIKLYYHKTDGGAEYLCTSHVKGTTEGLMTTAVVRLDGRPEALFDFGRSAARIAELEAENARLRELLADAEKYLRSSGLDPEEADNLADEIRSLLISLEAE